MKKQRTMPEEKFIKGLLIDPDARTITEVQVEVEDDGTNLESMYKLLDCRYVDVGHGGLTYLPGNPQDDIWFDDEGCFRENPNALFEIPDWVPLIGKGLILGHDDKGNSTDHSLSEAAIAELGATIKFYHRKKGA